MRKRRKHWGGFHRNQDSKSLEFRSYELSVCSAFVWDRKCILGPSLHILRRRDCEVALPSSLRGFGSAFPADYDHYCRGHRHRNGDCVLRCGSGSLPLFPTVWPPAASIVYEGYRHSNYSWSVLFDLHFLYPFSSVVGEGEPCGPFCVPRASDGPRLSGDSGLLHSPCGAFDSSTQCGGKGL